MDKIGLDLIFNRAYDLYYYKRNNENFEYLTSELFSYLISMAGFSGYPLVLSQEDYSRLPGKNIYRGVYKNAYHENMLTDPYYYRGTGCSGSGLYFSSSIDRALEYTENEELAIKESESKILRAKLSPKTRLIEDDKLRELRRQLSSYDDPTFVFSEELLPLISYLKCQENQDVSKYIINLMRLDKSLLAVALEYDVVKLEFNKKVNDFILLNRGRLVVSDKEYKRITRLSDSEVEEVMKRNRIKAEEPEC